MRVTIREYYISIKTAPHEPWLQPHGWGPYQTATDAETARVQAENLWMRARVGSQVVVRDLTTLQVTDLRALGCTVAEQ